MKREKSTGSRTDPCEHLDGLERSDFCDFGKPRKHAYQKGKIESNKQSEEGGQPKQVVKKGLMPDRVESFFASCFIRLVSRSFTVLIAGVREMTFLPKLILH